jgi:serine/threonine protein kinase
MMPIPTRSGATTSNSNRIGRYYLVREIGRGSFGTVYVARDPVIDRNVAIKTRNAGPSAVSSKQAEAQFINEARAAGRLNHPNIITVFDASNEGGVIFIAMEYLQGSELSKLLDAGTQFSAADTAGICWKLADALAHAHKNGVVHRDINPSNIFMVAGNQPKIFDFGIARAPNRLQDQHSDEDDAPFTLFHDNLIGTPNYMSPEQATGRQVDHLTDIYSLGAVMYEMLTQRKPFQSETTEKLLEAIAHKAPQAPHDINRAIPLGLSQIAMKAMSKRPEKRYQNAQEMAQDIDKYTNQEQLRTMRAAGLLPEPEDEEPAKPSPFNSAAVKAVIGLIAVTAAGAYYWFH